MSLPPYPQYRPSGVEWLGDVPEHWGTGRVGALFRLKSGGTPSTDVAAYWDGDIPWVSAKDMKSLRIIDAEDHITPQAVVESATSLVPAGAALVVARSGILKHTLPVAVAEREVAINQDIKGCLPDSTRIDSYFFAYWVQGHQPPLLTLWRQQGATVESLDVEKVKTASLPLPPLAEQRAIADFLDRETAKIDTLVAKKRTLIERLKEKRTAIISRTVARGLPPDAARAVGLAPRPKLKPSGIDWLGDVPEHWRVQPLKYTTDFINGMAFKPDTWSTDGVPIIRIENLNGGPHFNCYEGEVSERFHVGKGDLLFGWSGNRGTSFGPFLWWREGLHFLNQHIFKLVGFACDKSWLYWCLKAVTRTIEEEAHGIIGMVHVTRGKLGGVHIPVLPLVEQRAIADFLDHETAKIDGMVVKVETAIERLQEYRTALIFAAVTGKFDVRGAAA